MESSSENSFTWTDTSSDSINSHATAAEDKSLENRSSCDVIKVEHDNKLNMEKGKHSEVKKKMVKIEPESDCDISRKVKKIKKKEINGYQKNIQDSTAYDESYLDLQVKQEEITSVKKRKKKIKKSESLNESDSESSVMKRKVKETSPESHVASQNIQHAAEGKVKTKKKKSKRKHEDQEAMEIEYKLDHDSLITDRINMDSISNKHTNGTVETSLIESTSDNETCCNEISAIQCDDRNIHTVSFNCEKNLEREKRETDSLYKNTLINQFSIQATESRKSRLSDRIRFEDDSDTELSHAYQNKEDKTSSKLQKFIKASSHMKVIPQDLHQRSNLTFDDEIWIIQCPKEIDVQAFLNTDLNMHGKSKIKVGGLTYDGTLEDEECNTAAILTMEHLEFKINNVPLSGTMKFRKRIPKAHFRDDNIMVNNQTNFIPLPETKCRHPLFGSNYKKALKVPVAIALRLNSPNKEEKTVPIDKQKKKKHKKNKSILEYEETDSISEVLMKLEPDPTLQVTGKKRKKRKHADDEGPAPKRVKRIKHDPESEEAWESEKAIEQNLFNF